MHIKISRSSLSEALSNVESVVATKASLPILQNVKITAKDGKATFVCSDLSTTLFSNAECEVIEEGETTVPAKTFSTAVSKVVEGIIDITVDDSDVAKLTAGTSKFSFRGISAKEFPTMSTESGKPVTIQSSMLRDMLRKTSFAMCLDETRAVLNAVLLDFSNGGANTIAVATDGRRLSMLRCSVETPVGFNGKFILPRKAVDVLAKKLPTEGDCGVASIGNQLRFVTSKFELCTKLVDQDYPNYINVIPKETKETVVVDREAMLGALDRVSVFTKTDMPMVFLTFADNRIVLNSADEEYGSSHDEVDAKYSGEKIEMKVNPQYVRDALNVLDEDEVEISLNNGSSPAVIRKVGAEDYTYVVMPLRT